MIIDNKKYMIMKRNFPLFGAIVLLALASCAQEMEADKTVVPSPDYDPETNTVKTQFVLSVSTEAQQETKTTADFVQYKKPFLGMEQVHLLAYELNYSNEKHGSFLYNPFRAKSEEKGPVTYEPIPADRDYNLGSLFPEGADPTRTVELALPLYTNALLLYGKAAKNYSDDLQGKIAIDGKASDITSLHFDLQPRLSSQDEFDVGAFFFSSMLTYFSLSGLVNETKDKDHGGFWDHQTGIEDKSYGFWWPIPQKIFDDDNKVIYNAADTLKKYYSATPEDQTKTTEEHEDALNGIQYTYFAGQISWKQLGTMYDWEYDGKESTKSDELVKTNKGKKFGLFPLGETMGYAYSVLTTIKINGKLQELRAGCASAILRTMEDLYAVVDRCADAEPTGWEENIAMLLAKEVRSRMQNYFHVYTEGFDFIKATDGLPDMEALYSAVSNHSSPDRWNAVKRLFDTYFYNAKEDPYVGRSYFVMEDNEGFPVNVGLPAGAAILACNTSTEQSASDQFSYNQKIPAYGLGEATFPIQNYRYPAELIYYANSAIRTSANVIQTDKWPSTIGMWDNDANWSDWNKFASVASDTRSVAMINNINYGTALLESKVSFGASTLKDNRKNCTGEPDNEIKTSYTEKEKGIFVTGIVVGGMADVMGWDLTRQPLNANDPSIKYDETTTTFTGMVFKKETEKGIVSNEFDKMIYDKVLNVYGTNHNEGYKVGIITEPIYTMVWDNYDATKAANDQSDVYVGLELVNNTDEDFWGELNLIRKGGTFYLLGKLDISDAIARARDTEQGGKATAFTNLDRDWDCYPPYDPANGNTINAPRVFMQDYITTANLILGEDCLKHAYVTVPDLRSSQISLGLSVDMSWDAGLTFDVQMGVLE